MLDLWYKNAIIYCLDVESFQDSDGDGTGDFRGLTNRLGYLAGLGVTCIWILPFYPTPNKDNGYDVMDYYGIETRLGTLGDFVEFTRQAQERGIRILIDLVVNHTSDQHPWFQAARVDRNSQYRDFYVWADEKPEDAEETVIFPGVQESTWTWEEQTKAFYHHRFYKHQPDLNLTNPRVREEICRIMGFWLELGVSGFRVDAAPFLIEMQKEGTTDGPEEYAYLQEFREFLSWRRGDAILLAEANVPMDEIVKYVGDGDKMHLLFNFVLNQALFLALVRCDATPIVQAIEATPPFPDTAQWANFIRNHDELSLDKLSEEERQEVFAAFGPDPEMQLYERGLRRRLPPMMDGDERRIALTYSLLFTLPGTPVLRYGEEIGMGEDLSLPERESVRTPMQWADESNAGFSTAPTNQVVRPVIDNGPFTYKQINVAEQRRDPDSLLNKIERMVRTRREQPPFGWAKPNIVDVEATNTLALRYEWRGTTVIAVHNLADEKCDVTLRLESNGTSKLIDLLGDKQYEVQDGNHHVELEGYGYRWFRVDG